MIIKNILAYLFSISFIYLLLRVVIYKPFRAIKDAKKIIPIQKEIKETINMNLGGPKGEREFQSHLKIFFVLSVLLPFALSFYAHHMFFDNFHLQVFFNFHSITPYACIILFIWILSLGVVRKVCKLNYKRLKDVPINYDLKIESQKLKINIHFLHNQIDSNRTKISALKYLFPWRYYVSMKKKIINYKTGVLVIDIENIKEIWVEPYQRYRSTGLHGCYTIIQNSGATYIISRTYFKGREQEFLSILAHYYKRKIIFFDLID